MKNIIFLFSLLFIICGCGEGPAEESTQKPKKQPVSSKLKKTASSKTTHLAITITTKTGDVIKGILLKKEFNIITDFGQITITMDKVRALYLINDKMALKTRDNNILKGKLLEKKWAVKTKFAQIEIETQKIVHIVNNLVKVNTHELEQLKRKAQQNKITTLVREKKPIIKNSSLRKISSKNNVKFSNSKIKPIIKLSLRAAIGEMLISKNKRRLYILNTSGCRLIVVDIDSFTKIKEITLAKDTTVMSMTPDGRKIFAAGKNVIDVVNLKSNKLEQSINIKKSIYSLHATNHIAYAISNAELLSISIPEQKIIHTIPGPSMIVASVSNKIYTSSGVILLPEGEKETPPTWHRYYHHYLTHKPFRLLISPDKKYAIENSGVIFRLGKSYVAEMLPFYQTDKHIAGVFLKKTDELWLFTSFGFIKTYDNAFELKKSQRINLACYRVIIDEERKEMYVLGGNLSRAHYYRNKSIVPGDLYKFSLPE